MRLVTISLLASLLAMGLASCAGNETPQKTADKTAMANKSDIPAQSSENPYINNYVSRGRPSIALQPDPGGAKIYRGKNQVSDYKRMLENGFDMLGYSSFRGTNVAPEKATEQAKAIKADLVLVYAEQKASTPASVHIDQARKAKKAQVQGGTASENAPMPEDQKLYEYFASYWVKLAPPLIGVHVEANTQDDKQFGLRVIAVVKESPAARAAIQEDDVLKRIGDVALDRPAALTQAAQRYAGQTVEVLYKRGDNDGKTTMTLNSRLQ